MGLHSIHRDEKVYDMQRNYQIRSDDGWWNAEKMVIQAKEAIDIFNKAFPGNIAVFAFDNSSGHACKGKDALIANIMNL